MNSLPNPAGRVRLGMAGFGAAARAFLPALAQHPAFELVAIADPVAHIRNEAASDFGIAAYGQIAEMLLHPGIDAVYVGYTVQLRRTPVDG